MVRTVSLWLIISIAAASSVQNDCVPGHAGQQACSDQNDQATLLQKKVSVTQLNADSWMSTPPPGGCTEPNPKACPGYYMWGTGEQMPDSCHSSDYECPLVCDPWTTQYCWNHNTQNATCEDVKVSCPNHYCSEGQLECPGAPFKDCGADHTPLPAMMSYCYDPAHGECHEMYQGCCAHEKWCPGPVHSDGTHGAPSCVPQDGQCPIHPVTCHEPTPKKCPGHYDMWYGDQFSDTCHSNDHECPVVCNPWTEQYCWNSVTHEQFCGDVHVSCPLHCTEEQVECPGSGNGRQCDNHPPRPPMSGYCTDPKWDCPTWQSYAQCCPDEIWCPDADPMGPGFCHPGSWADGTQCPEHPPTPPGCAEKTCPGQYMADGTQMPETCHPHDHECPLNCNPWTHQYCHDHSTDKGFCGDVNEPCPANCAILMPTFPFECPGSTSRECNNHPPIPAHMGYCMESEAQCQKPHLMCCPDEMWCPDGDISVQGSGSCHPMDAKCPELPTVVPSTPAPLPVTLHPSTAAPLPGHPPVTAAPGTCTDPDHPKACAGYYMWGTGVQMDATCHSSDHECSVVCDPWTSQHCWDPDTQKGTCGDVHAPCPNHYCHAPQLECPGAPSKDCGADHPPLPAMMSYCYDPAHGECHEMYQGCCAHEKWCPGPVDSDGTHGAPSCVPNDGQCPIHPVTCHEPTPKKCPGHYNMWDGDQMSDTCHSNDQECPLVCNPWTEQYCWNSVTHESFCGDVHVQCPLHCTEEQVECPGQPNGRQCDNHPPRPPMSGYCTDPQWDCWTGTYTQCCPDEIWCPDADPMGPGYCHPGSWSDGTQCPEHPPTPPGCAEKTCPGQYMADGTQMPETCHPHDHECPLNCNPWTHQYCHDFNTDTGYCGNVTESCHQACATTMPTHPVECPGSPSRECKNHPPIPAGPIYCMESQDQCQTYHVHCCPDEMWCADADPTGPGSCHPMDAKCPELPPVVPSTPAPLPEHKWLPPVTAKAGACTDPDYPKACAGYFMWGTGEQMPDSCHASDYDCQIVCDPWTSQHCWDHSTQSSKCGDVHVACPMEECAAPMIECPGTPFKDCGADHPPFPTYTGYCQDPAWGECHEMGQACCANERSCPGPDPNGPWECHPIDSECPVHPVTCHEPTPKKCPGHYNMWDGTQMDDTCHANDQECPLVCNPWMEQFCWDSVENKQFCGDVQVACPVHCTGDQKECPSGPGRQCDNHPPRPPMQGWCQDPMYDCGVYIMCCPDEIWCPDADPTGPGYCHPGSWTDGTKCPEHPPPAETSSPDTKKCPGPYNPDGTQMPETSHPHDAECPLVCNPWTHQFCYDPITHTGTCGEVDVPCPANCATVMPAHPVECPGSQSRECNNHPPVPAYMGYCMESQDQCQSMFHIQCCPDEMWCADADPFGPGSCHPMNSTCPPVETKQPEPLPSNTTHPEDPTDKHPEDPCASACPPECHQCFHICEEKGIESIECYGCSCKAGCHECHNCHRQQLHQGATPAPNPAPAPKPAPKPAPTPAPEQPNTGGGELGPAPAGFGGGGGELGPAPAGFGGKLGGGGRLD